MADVKQHDDPLLAHRLNIIGEPFEAIYTFNPQDQAASSNNLIDLLNSIRF
ncbi:MULTISPECIES: hypothetical protein [Yersinia pseudotuberculosis complex]|uniref:Uncharacterized protein n=1 Tax=Yersinia pseudotuberculosis serotype O:1b (strain IP 31758) TaxID=349747 RepID=A0A0U1QV10_YERP3|nr:MULTISPECIES: hypothetical protein [Yersinia pseudotuberculosis complex]ABS46309.1 hypothetical protein YpsIP31758_1490 [Yersinia pseudotuberculosis IP 31758]MCE4111171.1 hypothetical protein [Yersinia pseudotuberculosis]MCF1162599.1 hypothetical protein [Yersinia pseudotuberculosis]UFA61148.1 Uncharacterized protein YP598_1527 [Yersinia pseudotuberculosis]WLF05254.1 hypothetical protein Q6G25_07440 [Yersinia pseudotuberculosis]